MLPRLETKQGIALQHIKAVCFRRQATEFQFDISEFLVVAGVNNSNTLVDVSVHIWCWSPIVLNFSNHRNLINKNILLYLRIAYKCRVSMQNVAAWAKAIYLYSIDLGENTALSVMNSAQGHESIAGNFKDVAFLETAVIPSMFTDPNVVWPNMASLTIYGESIKTIPPYWKNTMPKLQILCLGSSNVKELPEFPWNNSTREFFHGLRHITPFLAYSFGTPLSVERNLYPRELFLKKNNIEDLSSHIFQGFLHSLSLEGNGLKAVGPSCFRNLEGLESIELANNKLVSLPETLFHGLTSLRYISLANNNISFLKPEQFEGLRNVRRIALNGNNLNYIPKGLFSSLKTLELLHLESNKITGIGENQFSRHSALREVLLQNNQLSSIPTWIFRLSKIEVINLSFNKITGFQGLYKALTKRSSLFRMIQRHVTLNLENNNITAVGDPWQLATTLNYYNGRFEIKLTGNPLTCDCEMSIFVERIYTELRLQVSSWQCGWPDQLKGKSILEVSENQWMRKEELQDCPAECVCRKRCTDEIIVVNCEGKGLSEVPSSTWSDQLNSI